ncbi:NADPH-dependent FMN reductase [Nonomuraea sp. LPB2021202275-12-8]|uniref:NADPH-dependent FMN reductase n=1 Tax=Nonomuraea sp. LPB2021202275-12-8 TaxID=3120159 RepID=UPI00300C7AEC
MIRIAIVIGSTRPTRRTEVAARWVAEAADRHPAAGAGQVTFEVVDLAAYGLPLLDEPLPALFGDYRNEHTLRWAAAIGSFDGFVFVTPEYNHSIPAALKNAIDYLFTEWNDKAAAFVSHGVHGGTRAVEQLRLTLAELKVATVRTQVALSAFTDFEVTDPAEPGVCAPGDHQEPTLHEMLDELISWSQALKPLRESATAAGLQPA